MFYGFALRWDQTGGFVSQAKLLATSKARKITERRLRQADLPPGIGAPSACQLLFGSEKQANIHPPNTMELVIARSCDMSHDVFLIDT